MLLAGKRFGHRLKHRRFQLNIRPAGDDAHTRPEAQRQRARRFELLRVLNLRTAAQNQRPLHQRMLLVREAVRLRVDAAQHALPDLAQLLGAHGLALDVLPALLELALKRRRRELCQPARAERRKLRHHLLEPAALHGLDRLFLPAADKHFFLPEHEYDPPT